MRVVLPIILAWLSGVLTVIAFFIAVDYDDHNEEE